MEDLRVIISGGGTGGHIFPAVSIANALKELRGEVKEVHETELPTGEKRCVIEVVQTGKCPAKYPRASGAIRKKPL